jgi:dUTP pyrophosphatase
MTRPTLSVAIQRLHPDARFPAYQTHHAAGMDLHACLDEPVVLQPGHIQRIPCGFALAIPPGFEGQVRPRSGLASRHGITLINSPGTLDADYRGEVQVPLINHGNQPFTLEPDTRIAQLLITEVPRVSWDQVDDLPPTPRGTGGFGHTGT